MKTEFFNDGKKPVYFRGNGLNEGTTINPQECKVVEIGTFFKIWDYDEKYVILTR